VATRNLLNKAKRNEERETVKSLVSLLPKIRVQSRKEDYLATLDDADKRRVLLREYFRKLRRKRPAYDMHKRLSWLVSSTPFPQLFEFREGDEELFADCNVVRFTNFLSAYKLYISLLKFEIGRARSLTTASAYRNPRREEP